MRRCQLLTKRAAKGEGVFYSLTSSSSSENRQRQLQELQPVFAQDIQNLSVKAGDHITGWSSTNRKISYEAEAIHPFELWELYLGSWCGTIWCVPVCRVETRLHWMTDVCVCFYHSSAVTDMWDQQATWPNTLLQLPGSYIIVRVYC